MTIAFRELQVLSPDLCCTCRPCFQEPGKICRMYEGAVSKDPHNEEFLTHLFMSYVRCPVLLLLSTSRTLPLQDG